MAEPTSGYGEMPMQTPEQQAAEAKKAQERERMALRVTLAAKFPAITPEFADLAVDIWLDGKND